MGWVDRLFKSFAEERIDEMVKARSEQKALPQPQAFEFDPFDLVTSSYHSIEGQTHWHPGTMGLDFETLRRMARVPLISAVIQTRVNQVAEFTVPQQRETDLGFRVRLRDKTKAPTAKSRKRAQELTDWIMRCGIDDAIGGTENTFETFLRKVVRDSLIFDQCAFEVMTDRSGNIAGIVPVDASTIRRARLRQEELDAGRRIYRPDGEAWAQILEGKIVAAFSNEELVVGIRRPRTWTKVAGYGYPELEELVGVITNLLNAEGYNAQNFTHGMHTAGILAIKSKMNPQMFRTFRREFYAMLSGAHNAKKTPLVQLDPDAKEELQAVNLSSSNREMEYGQWISWLLRTTCSVYQISPSALGGQWTYGNEGQTNSLATASPVQRVTHSDELGLRPLLRAVEGWLNRGVMRHLDPDYELAFVGFDADSESNQLDLDTKKVRAFMTINEVRARYDLPALDSDVGDMILDSTYINTAWQMGMADEEAPPEGEDAEGGGEGGFDLDALLGSLGGDQPPEEGAPAEEGAPPEEAPGEQPPAEGEAAAVDVEV